MKTRLDIQKNKIWNLWKVRIVCYGNTTWTLRNHHLEIKKYELDFVKPLLEIYEKNLNFMKNTT